MLATLDIHEQFVQVPGITQASLPSLECPGVISDNYFFRVTTIKSFG